MSSAYRTPGRTLLPKSILREGETEAFSELLQRRRRRDLVVGALLRVAIFLGVLALVVTVMVIAVV